MLDGARAQTKQTISAMPSAVAAARLPQPALLVPTSTNYDVGMQRGAPVASAVVPRRALRQVTPQAKVER